MYKKDSLYSRFKMNVQYKFDNLMNKGTVVLVLMLFLFTACVVTLAGLLVFIFGSMPFGEGGWTGVMHIIDAGTITGAELVSPSFIIVMSIVTICGLLMTSILVGIITSGFEGKLRSLKKGNSNVVEKNHTVILGYNENIFSIIKELITANENKTKQCIVILSQQEKEMIEEAIKINVKNFKTTKVVVRTGKITDVEMLFKCSLDKCRSVIINKEDDFITIKVILAIRNFFMKVEKVQDDFVMPNIVASIYNRSNFEAAQIAIGNKVVEEKDESDDYIDYGDSNDDIVHIMKTEDTIARIMAQTCRQPGLSRVLIDLFDFSGDELYFENFDELAGEKFADVLLSFEKAVIFGFQRNGKTYINPSLEEVIQKGDLLLILMEDDGQEKPQIIKYKEAVNTGQIQKLKHSIRKVDNILILGTNSKLQDMLEEIDQYAESDSLIKIAVSQETDEDLSKCNFKNIKIQTEVCDIDNRNVLNQLIDEATDSVVLLSHNDCDVEASDAKTLVELIHLRDIREKRGINFSITSEMLNFENQKLAKSARVNDFIIGKYLVNLMLTQISESPGLKRVFDELLSSKGNEVYIREIENYPTLPKTCDFYTVTQTAMVYGEIAVGYRMKSVEQDGIVLNPHKSKMIDISQVDALVVLSAD